MNRNNRRLFQSAYVLAATLIALPIFDATMAIRPFHLGEARWRFGAVGILTNALMLPTAGFVIAGFVAQSQEHRRFLRFLGALSLLVGVVCVLAMGAFALDALQSAGTVRTEVKIPLAIATVAGLVKLILGA